MCLMSEADIFHIIEIKIRRTLNRNWLLWLCSVFPTSYKSVRYRRFYVCAIFIISFGWKCSSIQVGWTCRSSVCVRWNEIKQLELRHLHSTHANIHLYLFNSHTTSKWVSMICTLFMSTTYYRKYHQSKVVGISTFHLLS